MERVDELGCKAAALLILMDHNDRLIIPSRDEWIGIHLLERDGELKRKTNGQSKHGNAVHPSAAAGAEGCVQSVVRSSWDVYDAVHN